MFDPRENERYEVLATLAEGPHGSSYRVQDNETGEQLLVRLLGSDALCDAPSWRRALRDARVAMRVRDQHLVPYRDAELHNGRLLLKRSWARGESLLRHPRYAVGADPQQRGARATAEDLVDLAGSALQALHVLHARGLLARRLRPANLVLDEAGDLRLTDWGIRVPGERDERGTKGTAYTAPEVVAGLPGDPRSDLYALGILLFELATGRLPQPVGIPAPDLERLGGRLARVVSRLLASEPSARYPAASEALKDLGRPVPFVAPAHRDFRSPRLVGRDAERAELSNALARLGSGHGDLVFLRGGPGIGKSRLLAELARDAALKGVRVLESSAPEPSDYPLGRLAPCFESIAREMKHWPAEEVSEALQNDGRVLLELTPVFHSVPGVKALGEAPIIAGEASRRRLLRVAARIVAAFARRVPTLLILDDFHSADPLSLELLRLIARTVIPAGSGKRPAALLVAVGYHEVEAAGARGVLRAASVALRARGLAREVVLKPLAPHEVRDLVTTELSAAALPDGFLAKLMTETGGTPLVIEETLSGLAASRVFDGDPAGWAAAWDQSRGNLAARRRPDRADDGTSLLLGSSGIHTVQPPLREADRGRLGRLGGEATRLLETLALAGDGTDVEVMRMASGLQPGAFEDVVVDAMHARVLVEEVPDRFRFRHEQISEQLLAGVDEGRRRAVHGRIGLAIEQHVGSLDERTPILLAHHFHLAGDVERSLLYLPLAARIFKDRHVPAEALARFTCFFRHLGALEPEEREKHLGKRLHALHAMAQTQVALERRAEASSTFREMSALAEGTGRDRDLVSSWTGLAALSLDAGDLDGAVSFARRAAALARDREMTTLVASNLMVIGTAARRRQKLNEAMWNLAGSLKIFREQGDVLGGARAMLAVGEIHAARHEYRLALAAFRKAYRQFRLHDDKAGVTAALNQAGRTQIQLGSPARALAYHREALRLEREADDRDGIGRTLDRLGEAYRERGDVDRAEEAFKEALAIKRELADVRGSADSLLHLGHTAFVAGRVDEAVGLLEQTLTVARRAGNAAAEAGALVRLAQARAARGESPRARALAEDGLLRSQAVGDRGLECRALLVLARLVDERGRATALAVRADGLAEGLGQDHLILQASLRLADLSREAGDADEARRRYSRALDAGAALSARGRKGSSGDAVLRIEESRLRRAAEFVDRAKSNDVTLRLAAPPEESAAAG